MAKKKTNRRSKRKSDAKISALKSPEKLNPFELKHEPKRKHNVIGKTTMRSEKGYPGLSKLKGIEKRKNTLLKDYLKIRKSNKFVDKRIGENESDLSLEDKMLARFAAERKRHRKDTGVLNDEEELTHFGHNLASIEKFDDPRSDDDDEQDRLSDEFVSNANFGGFMVKKDEASSAKTRDMLLAEIVLKSKERKELRQKERETSEVITEQLNDDWKSIQSLMGSYKKKADDDLEKTGPPLQYDMLVRELKFDARAQATTPLKTLEKLAEKQKKQEKKLEEMLLKRMALVDPTEKKVFKHRSADDLDDDFLLDGDIEDSKSKVLKTQQEEEDDVEFSIKDSNETKPCETVNDEEILEAIDNFISACRKENELLQFPTDNCQKSTSITLQNNETDEVLMLNANKNPIEVLFQTLQQLVERSPVTSAKMILQLLKGKRNQFLKMFRKKSLRKNILFDMIMLFKIVNLLYPTSDFRHPVTNVAMLFMAEILLKFNVNISSHVSVGIYICWLFSEFTRLSKRYVPETLVFLFTLLDSLTNKILATSTESTASENLRRAFLNKCLSLLVINLKDRHFSFFDKNSDKLQSNLLKLHKADFPPHIKENINSLKLLIENDNFKRRKLARQNIRKYNLKMLDPELKDYKDKKRTSDKQLLRKHQSEMKGAIREIRKDNRFLASQQLKEQFENDKVNKRKMKEFFSNVAEENGYYNKKARKSD